jgi:predicted nucleotidyltransferase
VKTTATIPDLAVVSKILKAHLPEGYSAVLFGSRATGRARPASDWDIGILGPAPLRGSVIQSIHEALDELPTLHSFEIVDLSTVPGAFREEALKHSIKLT